MAIKHHLRSQKNDNQQWKVTFVKCIFESILKYCTFITIYLITYSLLCILCAVSVQSCAVFSFFFVGSADCLDLHYFLYSVLVLRAVLYPVL